MVPGQSSYTADIRSNHEHLPRFGSRLIHWLHYTFKYTVINTNLGDKWRNHTFLRVFEVSEYNETVGIGTRPI